LGQKRGFGKVGDKKTKRIFLSSQKSDSRVSTGQSVYSKAPRSFSGLVVGYDSGLVGSIPD